jgi:PIN domain nuclease of toxin-antitoxin system
MSFFSSPRPVKESPLAAVEAIRASRESTEPIAIAACTLYEFALAIARNRIGTNMQLDQLMQASFPRDPFDRMIAATALVHGASLVTADGQFRSSGAARTIW